MLQHGTFLLLIFANKYYDYIYVIYLQYCNTYAFISTYLIHFEKIYYFTKYNTFVTILFLLETQYLSKRIDLRQRQFGADKTITKCIEQKKKPFPPL